MQTFGSFQILKSWVLSPNHKADSHLQAIANNIFYFSRTTFKNTEDGDDRDRSSGNTMKVSEEYAQLMKVT